MKIISIEQARDKQDELREILQKYGNEEYGDCIIDEITSLFDFPTTLDTDPDEEGKIEQARQTLKEVGYFVDNLWSIEDVQGNYNCTEEEAQQVLHKVLTNDATMEQIWFAIHFEAEELNLERCL